MSYGAAELEIPSKIPLPKQGRRELGAPPRNFVFSSSFGAPLVDDSHVLDRLGAGKATSLEAIAFLVSMAEHESDASVSATALLKEFGSLGAVFAASEEQFQRCLPNSSRLHSLMSALRGILTLSLQEPLRNEVILGTRTDLESYLKFTMANEENEVLRVLFLNSKNALIKDELHSTGTTTFVQMHPRQLVKRILEVGATAIFLVHNHPSGDPSPSGQDIQMTNMLASVLSGLDVVFHDHIIVGRRNCLSMRAMGYLEQRP